MNTGPDEISEGAGIEAGLGRRLGRARLRTDGPHQRDGEQLQEVDQFAGAVLHKGSPGARE